MSITDNNKLIAEFMGCKPIFKDKKEYQMVTHENMCYGANELQYHKDWNWLMQVVEKIENTKYDNLTFDVFISKNKTHIHYSANNEWFSNIFLYEGKTKIENTYNACVEFIKWYNENSR